MSDWKKIKTDDPKRLAKLTEAAFALDTERKNYERQAQEVGDEVKQIKALIIHDFDKGALNEIKTRFGTARLVTKDIPVMDPETGGWEAIYKYIVKHKAWDILQKRLGERACQERWEDKQKIPGVKQFTKADIKLGDAE